MSNKLLKDNGKLMQRLDEFIPLAFTYNAVTSAPAAGSEFRMDNTDLSLVTELFVSNTDINSMSMTNIIGPIVIGQRIIVQNTDISTQSAVFEVTATPVLASNSYTIAVTYEDDGGETTITDGFKIGFSIYGTSGGGSTFEDDVFRVQDNGDNTKEIALEASAITTGTTRTITMPDNDVDLGDIALNNTHRGSDGSDHSFIDQDVTIGSSPTLNGSNFTNVTKIIFSDYIIGTTDGPTTTVTTSGTAVVIAEMTKTFTPASATNKIEVGFAGSFNNSGDQTAIVGIFIDGDLEAETETREYANAGVFPGSIYTFWQGTHATSEMIITVRMWTTGGTLTATGVLRKMIVKEITE